MSRVFYPRYLWNDSDLDICVFCGDECVKHARSHAGYHSLMVSNEDDETYSKYVCLYCYIKYDYPGSPEQVDPERDIGDEEQDMIDDNGKTYSIIYQGVEQADEL